MRQVELKARELPYAVNEEIKYLRTNIQFSGEDKKVILFTSASAGEGKSTVALELARSLAELQKRVLLIDCDLRRSVMDKNLKITAKGSTPQGLSHFLSGMAGIKDVLCAAEDPKLYLIVAGPAPPNPSELLSGKLMGELLKWARNEFDYVLVDTAPLGMVIDAATLAPRCDGAVILIESDRVPYRTAQSMVRQLNDARCPVIGVALNKVSRKSGNRYYNRYYKKYGGEY